MKLNYQKHKIINVINITKVVTLFSLDIDKDYFFPGEKHDFWEIVYAEQGSSKIYAGAETMLLNQGCCVFHKPNEFHSVCGNGETPSAVTGRLTGRTNHNATERVLSSDESYG